MRISRLGLTPVKGGRHRERSAFQIGSAGPVGDRLFALADRASGSIIRTVSTPQLVSFCSRWDGESLTVEVGGVVHQHEAPPGQPFSAEYWGRRIPSTLVGGAWSDVFSAALGRDVVLARADEPWRYVYGAPVTLLSATGLEVLGERMGEAVDAGRFRATAVIDDGDEDSWPGRILRLGDAIVRVTAPVVRCAVIDIDPAGGGERRRVLQELARYRQRAGGIHFGVQAEVVRPGPVEVGAVVQVG